MPSIAELRDKKVAAAKEIRRLADAATGANCDFTAEEKTQWERANADYDSATAAAERLERAETIERELERPEPTNRRIGRDDYDGHQARAADEPDRNDPDTPTGPTEADRQIAIGAWARRQSGLSLTKHEVRACKVTRINPNGRDLILRRDPSLAQRETRALSATTGASGGFTVPQGFMSQFETALLEFGGVRQVAEVITTDSGAQMPWPTADDTGNVGELLAENTAAAEQDVTVARMVLDAYKYSSKLIKVPVELLEDSAFDIASKLGEMLGERIGRITNQHFTTGTGSAQPNGIVTAATLGKTAASATAVTADEILDLVYSIDPAYATRAGFMMHNNIVLAIRKLKDSQNQYLWVPGMQPGEPDRLLGYPIQKNQQMASTLATTNRIIVFGDLSKYKIRDVRSMRLRRLVERYADADQEGFVAFSRHDGDLLNAGTAPVKYLRLA